MLGRRDFLARSFGAGAVLATVGISDVSKAFALTAPTGFKVGQVLRPISGIDQYNATRRSTAYRSSWFLVDLCPWWCGPCQSSATQHAAFRQYIQANGIPFHIFSVVVEDQNHKVSTRLDAERWAETFDLCHDIVLHDNGNVQSPLRNLFTQFAIANGNSSPAYPCYALVDPAGVIRYYQAGADLDQIQAELAAMTGKTLTQTWTLPLPPPIPTAKLAATITINGQYDDSSPINETIDFNAPGPDFALYGPGILPLSGFTYALTTATVHNFDPTTPLKLTFTQTSPPVAFPYTRLSGVANEVAYAPNDAFNGSQLPVTTDPNLTFYDSGVVATDPGGVSLDLEPIATAFPQDVGGHDWSTVWFDATVNSPTPERWSMAYSLTDTLIGDVTNSSLSATTKTSVIANLKQTRVAIRARNFAAAATYAQRAENKLAAAGADLALQTDTSWLTSHLTDLANQP
jgi:hypothetical protein